MSKKVKLREKFFENPIRDDITFEEVKTILFQYGFSIARSNGSHNIFVHESGFELPPIVTVSGRYIKKAYVNVIRDAINRVEEE